MMDRKDLEHVIAMDRHGFCGPESANIERLYRTAAPAMARMLVEMHKAFDDLSDPLRKRPPDVKDKSLALIEIARILGRT